MQNYFLFSHLFAWNSYQDNRASASKTVNSAIHKLKRALVLFLLGLTFFCSISILIFNRHQPVAATEVPVEHQSEAVTNIATGDYAPRWGLQAEGSPAEASSAVYEPRPEVNSGDSPSTGKANRWQILDYDLPSNPQTAITAQIPVSNSSATPIDKIPKHLNNFKTEETLSENKTLSREHRLVNTATRETPSFGEATSSKFVDIENRKPQSPTSLAKQLAIELPPLSSPEKYLPETFDGYIWPARGSFTSGYGWRWGRLHQGIDIAAPVGTPVMAAAAGTVIEAEWSSGGYGNLIKIQHSDGSITVYAHNNQILVSVGQQVEQNQQIAEMGNTGNSTGSHLHFEIHPSGDLAVDPMIFLSNR
nr:M23 family metallopeptidase [Myxosarcina sp. GI1]